MKTKRPIPMKVNYLFVQMAPKRQKRNHFQSINIHANAEHDKIEVVLTTRHRWLKLTK